MVYPRVCGGTFFAFGHLASTAGLKTAFTIGDEIRVSSDGRVVTQTLYARGQGERSVSRRIAGAQAGNSRSWVSSPPR